MPVINLKVSRIALVNHPEPHQRLQSIHGSFGAGEWSHSHEEAIGYLENRRFNYYLVHSSRAIRLTVGRTAHGRKFLKAETDRDVPALLLQLTVVPPASTPNPRP